MIEHDVDLIAHADYIIEMGPGGGVKGGRKIFEGSVENLIKSKKALPQILLRKQSEPKKQF